MLETAHEVMPNVRLRASPGTEWSRRQAGTECAQHPPPGHLELVYSMASLSITETGIETQREKNMMDCRNQTRPI